MSAHTRKLEERRARALARRAELGAENRAPEMNAPWALGESEAPRKMPPAAAPVAPDAPPTPRDLARANASGTRATRTAGPTSSRAAVNKRRVDGQAPVRFEFPARRQTDRWALVSGAETRTVVRCHLTRAPSTPSAPTPRAAPSAARSRMASYGGANGNGGRRMRATASATATRVACWPPALRP